MHAEPTIRERLRSFFSWQEVKTMLIVNTIISLIILFPNFTNNLKHLGLFFLMAQIYSQFIGFHISFFITMAAPDRIKNKLVFFSVVAVLIVLGGILGAVFAGMFCISIGLPNPFGDLYDYITEVAIMSLIFGFLAYSYFYLSTRLKETAEKLAEKEVIEERLRHTKTEAELDALRAKVNPHFLFNTLNSIAGLIHDQPDLAEEVTWKLADLLRSAMASGDQARVSLERELELVRAYLVIEKARLGDRLQYTIDCDPALYPFQLPIMLLQPLVENSVQHGIAPKREGGSLSLECRKQDDQMIIEIKDNGRGWDGATFKEGFGLGGVRERLTLSYGEAYDLEIINQDGVSLTMTLPCKEKL